MKCYLRLCALHAQQITSDSNPKTWLKYRYSRNTLPTMQIIWMQRKHSFRTNSSIYTEKCRVLMLMRVWRKNMNRHLLSFIVFRPLKHFREFKAQHFFMYMPRHTQKIWKLCSKWCNFWLHIMRTCEHVSIFVVMLYYKPGQLWTCEPIYVSQGMIY